MSQRAYETVVTFPSGKKFRSTVFAYDDDDAKETAIVAAGVEHMQYRGDEFTKPAIEMSAADFPGYSAQILEEGRLR